jgi:hypothetical protein
VQRFEFPSMSDVIDAGSDALSAAGDFVDGLVDDATGLYEEWTGTTETKETDEKATEPPAAEETPAVEETPAEEPAAPAVDTGGAVVSVQMTVTGNITNASGDVIGMSGTQTITYEHSDGRTITETYDVNWQEDNVVEGALAYEHPAAPGTFNIVPRVGGQTYPVNTDHPEQGIAIHAPGRSEGCILGGQASIIDDLEVRVGAGIAMTGEITTVTDSRSPADQAAAPAAW